MNKLSQTGFWSAWFAQHALYTDVHVSSTTAIAFIFIPLHAMVPGTIGVLFGWIYSVLKSTQKAGVN